MKRPALYIRGRIVVGTSHMAAFEQLSPDERAEDSISSGVFDTDTGEFCGFLDEEHFFDKEMLLIRHADVEDNGPDPGLSREGHDRLNNLVFYMQKLVLDEYRCLCSPMLRCLETAQALSNGLGLKFSVDPSLLEPPPFLNLGENFYVPSRCRDFPDYLWPQDDGWVVERCSDQDFVNRVGTVLRSLPQKSIIISHSGFVISMAKLALCESTIQRCGIPTASLTHIENREVRCLGRVI